MANYIIKWGNLYLYGFSQSGSSLWTADPESAVWLILPRANSLVEQIRILEDLAVEVEEATTI